GQHPSNNLAWTFPHNFIAHSKSPILSTLAPFRASNTHCHPSLPTERFSLPTPTTRRRDAVGTIFPGTAAVPSPAGDLVLESQLIILTLEVSGAKVLYGASG
ncbi:unnamed protein product, partial [Tuber aestivum]